MVNISIEGSNLQATRLAFKIIMAPCSEFTGFGGSIMMDHLGVQPKHILVGFTTRRCPFIFSIADGLFGSCLLDAIPTGIPVVDAGPVIRRGCTPPPLSRL